MPAASASFPPVFSVHAVDFDREGQPVDEAQANALLARVAQQHGRPLLVLCHGWNNDKAEATALYAAWLAALQTALQKAHAGLPAGSAPTAAQPWPVLALHWPSKRFADDELIPGGAASADGGTALLQAQIRSLADSFASLPGRPPGAEAAVLARLEALVPRLESDDAAADDFVRLLRSILPPGVNSEEPVLGDSFYTAGGGELLARLGRPFRPRNLAAGGAMGGGAGGGVGTAAGLPADLQGPGGAAFLGNLLSGARNGARNLLNLFTYYTMKERAGAVGSQGLHPLLRRLQQAGADLHLCGHSFGCRLLCSAIGAPGVPALPQPVGSLLLLQAAFSHWGFAQAYDGLRDGWFRAVLSERRVRGPLLVSHSTKDLPVGLAYPLASRLRNQVASGIGDAQDPYGGLGRNGAQKTPELNPAEARLRPLGEAYTGLQPGRVHNLEAAAFITGHSAVTGPEVAQAWVAGLALGLRTPAGGG